MSTTSIRDSYPNLSKIGKDRIKKIAEDKKFLRISFRKSSDFLTETMSIVPLSRSQGIMAIVGVVKAKKMKCDVAAIRFPKSQFSTEKAQQWLAENFSMNKD